MTQQAEQEFLRLLKKFHKLQPFTIEELTRLYLTENGHQWDSLHEIAAHEEIEKFLKEQDLSKKAEQQHHIL